VRPAWFFSFYPFDAKNEPLKSADEKELVDHYHRHGYRQNLD